MRETKYELPAWVNGLIVFLFTPALLLFIVSAFIAVAMVVAIIFISNLSLAVWCAITNREFKLKHWVSTEKQNKDKGRE